MKNMLVPVIVASLLVGSVSAWAGGSCCASKNKGDAKSSKAACSDLFSALNLSDEQKARISDLEKACTEEGSTKEACSKYTSAMRDVLTEDQRALFDEACKKSSKASGCKSDKSS